MAKRPRNIKAEEARRNEVARSLGFTSRAQMRRAQRHGYKPPRASTGNRRAIDTTGAYRVQPNQVPTYTARARKEREQRRAVGRFASIREESRDWSNAHSRVEASRYHDTFSDEKANRYHRAFLNPETKASRIENGFDSLRNWLVGELGLYDDVTFDERYGPDALAF